MCFYVTYASRALQGHDLSGEGINSGSHTHFLTTEGYGEPPRMSDQLNVGTTSETTRTLKTIHTIHPLIHSNKADMRRMIMMAKWYSGNHVGLKLPDICLTGEEKPRKNLTQGLLSQPRIEPGPTAWQARMLLPAPQRWTLSKIFFENFENSTQTMFIPYRNGNVCFYPTQCSSFSSTRWYRLSVSLSFQYVLDIEHPWTTLLCSKITLMRATTQ